MLVITIDNYYILCYTMFIESFTTERMITLGSKVEFIKKGIESRIGNRVRITTKEGRQKFITRKGVIENTYPDVFVVRFDQKAEGETCRTAFSYIDVLTHNIDIAVYAPTAS